MLGHTLMPSAIFYKSPHGVAKTTKLWKLLRMDSPNPAPMPENRPVLSVCRRHIINPDSCRNQTITLIL